MAGSGSVAAPAVRTDEHEEPAGDDRPASIDRIDRALMGLGALAALALSVPRLAERPLWLDEAFTVGATRDLTRTLRHTGGTMALYYAVVTPVARLADDSSFWLRFPSAVFAAVTVVLLYLLAHHLGGRRLAVTATALLASSWFLARYGVEARGYALALMLVAASWLGVVRAVDAEQRGDPSARRWWWLWSAATILAPLAHGLSVLQIPFQLVIVALSPGGVRRLRRTIPALLVVACELVGLFAIGAGEVADWIPPLAWSQVDAMQKLLFGRGISRLFVTVAVVAGVVVTVVEWRRARAPRRWEDLVPALWALGLPLTLIGLSLVRPYGAARYVLSSLPGVSLLVATVLVRLRPRLAYGLCVLVVVSLLLDQSYVYRNGLEDWKGLVAEVSADGRDGDRLLMPGQVRAAFDYALEHDGRDPGLRPLSPVDPIGPTRRFYVTAPGSMRARLLAAAGGRVWVVARRRVDLRWFEPLLADPAIRARYVVGEPREFDGPLFLVRLDPRPEPATS